MESEDFIVRLYAPPKSLGLGKMKNPKRDRSGVRGFRNYQDDLDTFCEFSMPSRDFNIGLFFASRLIAGGIPTATFGAFYAVEKLCE